MNKERKNFFWSAYSCIVCLLLVALIIYNMNIGKTEVLNKSETITGENALAQQTLTEHVAEEKSENPYEEEYVQLSAELEKLKEESNELKKKQEEGEKLLDPLHEYKKQVDAIAVLYEPMIEFGVDNFVAKYDQSGVEWMQNENKLVNAVAEVSKYTPWAITVNILAACSIDNTQSYYSSMVETNSEISMAYQPLIVDAKGCLEELDARIDFYKDLTDTYTGEEAYKNLALLNYIQDGEEICLDAYIEEVSQNLYILAKQFKASGEVYSSIYLDDVMAVEYINKHNELLLLIDKVCMGEKAEVVSAEKMGSYMIPILEAGKKAADKISSLPKVPMRNNAFDILYSDQLGGNKGQRVHYCEIAGDIILVNGDTIHVYYEGGYPYYINGYYIYYGKVLNGNPDSNAEVMIEEGLYMKGIGDRAWADEFYQHYLNLREAIGTVQQ